MKYMGSKNRHAKNIVPFLAKHLNNSSYYIEPFCGGCNVIDKVEHFRRVANDNHYFLIEMWRSLVYENWDPPKFVSNDMYSDIKLNKENYKPNLVGYVGFNSYGGKWFGGYRRDSIGKRDYSLEHYNNIMKQVSKLKEVEFFNLDYRELNIPNNSVVYCDPPYKNSQGYSEKFDSNEFFDWCRVVGRKSYILISEYSAPSDFSVVWEKEVNNTLDRNTGGKRGVEKLFIYNS
jgi:DNA adenine methylase